MTATIGVIVPPALLKDLFSPADLARLQALGTVKQSSATKMTAADAAQFLADCDVAIGSWGTPHPCEEILANAPKLRLWEHAAGSVKHMFGPHMAGRDLVIASCVPAIAECVAEMVLGVMIVSVKRVFENASANRSGVAYKPRNSKTLSDATIGIIAASQVGQRVIRLLQPFGARVLVYDPYLSEAQARAIGASKIESITELCRQSDVVSLHAPALEACRHMVDADQLQAMRDDAILINTSRGSNINEQALIAELKKGRLMAYLDVSDPEPAAADSPLRTLPNVVYTSHIAGGANYKIGKQAVDDVAAFLTSGKPKMVVTQEMLSRIA